MEIVCSGQDAKVRDHLPICFVTNQGVVEVAPTTSEDKVLDVKKQDWRLPVYIKGREESPMFLNIHTTAVLPEFSVENDFERIASGAILVSFGQIPLGQSVLKRIKLRNLSASSIILLPSTLNPHGPFSTILDSVEVEQGAIFELNVRYQPDTKEVWNEELIVTSTKSGMKLRFVISGEGISPTLNLADPDVVSRSKTADDIGECFKSGKPALSSSPSIRNKR